MVVKGMAGSLNDGVKVRILRCGWELLEGFLRRRNEVWWMSRGCFWELWRDGMGGECCERL